MGSGQSALDSPSGPGAAPAHPFRVGDGRLAHPLVREGALEPRAAEVEVAERALAAATLVVLPAGVGGSNIVLMVAVERIRQAGGFALVLAPTRAGARVEAERFAQALSAEAASRVRWLSAGSAKAARAEAFAAAWVLVATPEAVAAEVEAGRVTLDRCSLLVVLEAHRAVGASAHAQVVRALRRDRPRALTLGVSDSLSGDRRRMQATADALGLRRIDELPRADFETRGDPAEDELEVVEVALPEGLRAAQDALEAELGPRAAILARVGALPATPVRLLTRAALLEAGERLRKRPPRDRAAFHEALRAHGQALLLADALEALEGEGPAAFAAALAGLRSGADGSQAERALGAAQGVARARALLASHAAAPAPKEDAAVAQLVALIRERPGARAIVSVRTSTAALSLRDRLAHAPPLGPGIRAAVVEGVPSGAEAPVQVAVGAALDKVDLSRADLLLLWEVGPVELRALKSRRRRGRAVALVTADSRDAGALAAAETMRLVKGAGRSAWAPRGANRALPVEPPINGGRDE